MQPHRRVPSQGTGLIPNRAGRIVAAVRADLHCSNFGRVGPRSHYTTAVVQAADLAQFVQRRELAAYESRLARAAYAYGVDLRRSLWLDQSTLGEPLIRGVDRRWARSTAALLAEDLQ